MGSLEEADVTLRLHAFEPRSRANGPGVRAVLWLQGCDLACPGCYNPATHAERGGTVRAVADLAAEIEALGDGIEGISVSGGEPLQQPEGLLRLLATLRARTRLSVLLFSGYTIEEIRSRPLGPAVLDHLDVLVDGRFVARRRLARGLRGSANQRIHLLTDRYDRADVESVPEAEIRIEVDPKFFHAAGSVHGTVYFKAMDDAAFFAANSVVEDVFVLTTSFNIHLLRPVTEGTLIATGTLVSATRNLLIADAVLEAPATIPMGASEFAVAVRRPD